ncbi:MAG: hypothetical protein HZA22_10175 [Nitrospirae bacterium]|nr:hypothetical protein [Nitrospirota bacterium]MBI5695346.1 hypothetical protein [Nitrospirota bacterium]
MGATVEVFVTGTTLVLIKHPSKGNAENGRAICDDIRRQLGRDSTPICLFHDATDMLTANSEYAGEFKKLDKEIEARLAEVVCAIPGSIPRMMAHTVAMLSDKPWNIFKSKPEAMAYLNDRGFRLGDGYMTQVEAVKLVVLK